MGIAQPDQLFLGDADHGIGALDLAQGVGHAVDDAPVFADGDQVDDDFGVAGGLKDAAPLDQRLVDLVGVGEIAVVGDGEATELEIGEKRLDVAKHRIAGGRITDMTDGRVTG